MKTKDRYARLMFEEDTGGGGGSEPNRGLTALGPVAAQNEPAQGSGGDGDGGQGDGEGQQQQQQAPAFDPKALSTAFADAIKPLVQQQGQQQKKELTQEEARKLLKVMEFDDDFIKNFDNLETRKPTLEKLRDGFISQADTLTQYRLQEAVRQLESKFGPVMEYMQRMEGQQQESRLAASYPQLGNEKLKPLVHAVGQELLRQGKRFDNESSMFKALAEGVESVIKETNPDFKLTPAGSNPAQQKSNGRQIPTTTRGSSGAGGGGSGAAPTQSKGLSIFPPIKSK